MYRLSFTDPAVFDVTDIEEVRLRFLIIANGLPNSIQLQDSLTVTHELDRLIKFYMNVFQYHIPFTTVVPEKDSPSENLPERVSMIKVGFAGLANLAGHSEFISLRMAQTEEFIGQMLKYWFSEDPERKAYRDESVLTLRNLSTNAQVAELLFNYYPIMISESIRIICTFPKEPVADDLVRFIANMAQLPAAGLFIIQERLIVKLLPFLNEEFQKERRQLISHILKSTFGTNDGLAVLEDPEVEILSYVLLPLAGGEEFTEEEYDKMPTDLQYLPTNKARDSNGEVRYNLVSCIVNLSSTRKAREIMRKHNVYLILRELHKFEQNNPEGLAKTIDLIEDWVSAVILTDDDEVN